MNDTLVVQVDQPFQHLGYVHSYEVFWEFPESLANVVQRTVLAESARHIGLRKSKTNKNTDSRIMYRYSRVLTNPLYLTIFACYSAVICDVTEQSESRSTHIQVFEEINLGLEGM